MQVDLVLRKAMTTGTVCIPSKSLPAPKYHAHRSLCLDSCPEHPVGEKTASPFSAWK